MEMRISHKNVSDYLNKKDRRRNRYLAQKPKEALDALFSGRDAFDKVRII